jgi:PIN domain
MRSNITVIYDACVLYPAPLRDLLMRLALTDLYRARWTDTIHDEWIRNVLKQRPDLKLEHLERTRALMNAHVRDCLITDFDYLIDSISLPDKQDRHVVAAAIHCDASLIVTFNLKDFPPSQLERYSLVAQHPDEFIVDLMNLNREKVCEAVSHHRHSLKNPAKTTDEYLDTLLRQGLTQTVTQLRKWKLAI